MAGGSGKIRSVFNSQIVDIKSDALLLREGENVLHQIENDFLFVFAGGELPAEMLKRSGVQLRASEAESLAA